MSTLKRLASYQVASIASLSAVLISQIVSVPIILSRWTPTAFGAWLTIQAVVSLLSCPDWGLQDYVWIRGFQLGPKRPKTMSRLLGASMTAGVVFGTVEFLIALVIVAFGWHMNLLGLANAKGHYLLFGSAVAFLLTTVNSSIFGSVAAYINRIGQTVGLYADVTWWTAAILIVTSLVPAFAIYFGASMVGAAISQFIGVFAVSSGQTMYLLSKFSKLGIRPKRSHRGLPMLLFRRARLGYAKNIFEQARQQGVRVLLALLTAAADVAVFSTTRTIANIAFQAGITISSPVMPELASLIRERKAVQVMGAFTLVWIVMAVVIAPGALFLQFVGGFLFHHWAAKLVFDPWLLSTLVMSVVWAFGGFPSMALVRSQNDFVCLTRVMFISAIALVLTMLAFVPTTGALGGGLGLLAGEGTLYVLITYDAKRWMTNLNLSWPTHSLRLSQLSLFFLTVCLFGMAYKPHFAWLFIGLGVCLQAIVAYGLFKDLPESVKDRIVAKIRRQAN